MSRRRRLSLLLVAAAVCTVAALAYAAPTLYWLWPRAPGHLMTAADAHAKAMAGELVLVDVRRPSEWLETGVPASAHAITMHQDSQAFLAHLRRILDNDPSRPLALICRSGGRTSWLQGELTRAGFTQVINVAEGVAGGQHGSGWLRSGLPTRTGNKTMSPPVLRAGVKQAADGRL